MDIGTTTIDPAGPIFISYRHSDGSAIAEELAWLLRTTGIPVWRDREDLSPGDTNERLIEAIDDGISGGVLVVTPEVGHSPIIKMLEAPHLLGLHQAHSRFSLGIANAVENKDGGLDHHAPDRLLEFEPGTLRVVDQQATDRQGLENLVQRLLWRRIAHQRPIVAAQGSTFSLSVQTRNTPQVFDRTTHQLDIRIRPSVHERLPDPDGLRDLQSTLGSLPNAVTQSGAHRVRIHGGAHLSVAFTLGAALPSTRIGEIEVVDQRHKSWTGRGEARHAPTSLVRVAAEGFVHSEPAARPAVAVYLDLLPQPSNAAFERFLDEQGSTFRAWRHLTSTSSELLDPKDAGTIAAEAAAHIRMIANENGNAEVHLLLRCPFPIAVLTGRLLNTIRCVIYEWNDSVPVSGKDFRPMYLPTLRVRTSAANGPVEEVVDSPPARGSAGL
ncbi:SAVED domain-containing protein [Glycomyces dulcitolivorans]|uniref:SAVED domain-containing protein n=1 Tax=Glycomyces dulcitolivorans TaxID=2200759 RepID=UPI000DD42FCD|nr:SAVED domain-containing protein [Glycomyces dulcitolivorans]